MKKILCIFLLAASFVACSDEEITYNNTMKARFAGCTDAGCHNAGSVQGSLATYNDAVAFVNFGRILGALRHDAGFSPMPKVGAKWTDSQIQDLEDWINAGMPE